MDTRGPFLIRSVYNVGSISLRVHRIKTAINLSAAIALGVALASCSGNTPVAPTPIGEIRIQGPTTVGIQGATTAAGAELAPTNISWSCLTAGTAGIFGSASGCPAPRVVPQDVQVAADVPGPPTNLQHLVDASTVTLSWQPPSGPDPPTSYVIEAGSSRGSSDIAVFDTGNTLTSLTVNNVPGGTYFVRVRAKNVVGPSAPSNEVIVFVVSDPSSCTPAAPTGLAATVEGATATLTWNAPGGPCPVVNYGLAVGTSPGAINVGRRETGSAQTSFVVPGIPSGTFFVRVHAANGVNMSPPSNEVVVTVPRPSPNSTMWIGIVADGEGIRKRSGPPCGNERFDITLVLEQSDRRITGTTTITVIESPRDCSPVGAFDTQPIAGTVTGSLSDGSGTITANIGTGFRAVRLEGNFTRRRIIGTLTFFGGVTADLEATKQ
jgi:hypothetical protein